MHDVLPFTQPLVRTHRPTEEDKRILSQLVNDLQFLIFHRPVAIRIVGRMVRQFVRHTDAPRLG